MRAMDMASTSWERYFEYLKLETIAADNSSVMKAVPMAGWYCHLERRGFRVMGNISKPQEEWWKRALRKCQIQQPQQAEMAEAQAW